MKRWVEMISQDLRFGIRMSVRNPVFSLVMIFTLGLGIGANTALFSIVDAVLLRPLPFSHPEQLVTIENPGRLVNLSSDDPVGFLKIKERTFSLDSMGVYNSGPANLTDGLVPVRALVMEASASFFSTLGISPILGRTYLQQEEEPGHNRLAILSYGFWQSRYGADPNVLRRTIAINGRNFTAIGVMPGRFQFPTYQGKTDLWVPLTPSEHLIAAEGISYDALSRLKLGVTLRESQAEMDTIFHRLLPDVKDPNDPNRILVVPLRKLFEGEARPGLLAALLGAAGFVLLIACANAANLQLFRAAGRERETAVRRALGADRFRLVRQWLTESLLLALIGGAVGLLLTLWSLKELVLVGSAYLRNASDITVDSRILCFSLLISVASGVFFGLAPAIQFSNPDLSKSLKEGAKTSSRFVRNRLRQGIIIGEFALAVVLLTGTGLLLRTFENLSRIDPGFHSHNILTFDLSASNEKYPHAVEKLVFYQQVIERIKTIPGINAVGSVNHLPLDMKNGSFIASLRFDDRNSGPGRDVGAYWVVSPDYFRVMGVPMLNGRTFTERDNLQAAPVAIINQKLAQRVFGEGNPVGKHLSYGAGKTARICEIVGVLGNIRHWGLDKEAGPEVYLSSLQVASPFVSVAITGGSDVRGVTDAIRRAVNQIDKDQPIYNVRGMDQIVAESLSERRFVMILLGLFSALALLLSAVGIYGTMSYSTNQRIQEIGVRIALGAQRRDILILLLRQEMTLVLSGIGLGILTSVGLTRLLKGILFGVRPMDLVTLFAVSLILVAVAVMACCLPAQRALSVDPTVVLRYE